MNQRLWIIVIVLALTSANVSYGKEGQVDPSGPVLATIVGQKGTPGFEDGTGSAAGFGTSAAITTDGTNLYVADTDNHAIRKVVISTSEVTTLAGTAGVSGSSDGFGAAALFNMPKGITTDGVHLYVADTGNYTIRKIEISTGSVSTLAGTAGILGAADGIGSQAQFGLPTGIAIDGSDLYVSDAWNNTIRRVDVNSGKVTTLAGKAGEAGSVDSYGVAARFAYPTAITSNGTSLIVADAGNQLIRMIDLSTVEVTTLAGEAGFRGAADGIGEAALFDGPNGIISDGMNVYITDTSNKTIRKIDISSKKVSTMIGEAHSEGIHDGDRSQARIGLPFGITRVGKDLYLMDMGTIRRIE